MNSLQVKTHGYPSRLLKNNNKGKNHIISKIIKYSTKR